MEPETRAAFDEYVRMVAENNIERDGSSPESVAEVVVESTVTVGDEETVTTVAEPYADECITVDGVLEWTTTREYAEEDFVSGRARSDAVELMAGCIENAMAEVRTEADD